MKPKEGDRFTKNGKTFMVHFVHEGQVYGALWSGDDGRLLRCTLEEFAADVADADYEPGARSQS